MICPTCGAAQEDGTKFCTNCGAFIDSAPQQPAAPQEPAYQAPAYQQPAAPQEPAYQAPAYQQPAATQPQAYQQQSSQQPPYQQPAAPQTPSYQQPIIVNNTSTPITSADQLPEKFRPLSAWAYFGLSILFSIPIVGFIFLIIFSFNGSNINRRSFARSYWCLLILVLIIVGILAATGTIGGLAYSSRYW